MLAPLHARTLGLGFMILWTRTILGFSCAAGGAGPLLEACRLTSNKQNGLLARDGAAPRVLGSAITDNGAYGILLQV